MCSGAREAIARPDYPEGEKVKPKKNSNPRPRLKNEPGAPSARLGIFVNG
jgi:hypothetical protein